jgi:hypothetical protein
MMIGGDELRKNWNPNPSRSLRAPQKRAGRENIETILRLLMSEACVHDGNAPLFLIFDHIVHIRIGIVPPQISV